MSVSTDHPMLEHHCHGIPTSANIELTRQDILRLFKSSYCRIHFPNCLGHLVRVSSRILTSTDPPVTASLPTSSPSSILPLSHTHVHTPHSKRQTDQRYVETRRRKMRRHIPTQTHTDAHTETKCRAKQTLTPVWSRSG